MITSHFSVPIYQKHILDASGEQINYINNLPQKPNQGNYRSYNTYILEEEIFSNTKQVILEHVKNYFEDVFSPVNDVEIYITQSWLNWTSQKGFHHTHMHPNSFISGVYYPMVTEGEDVISILNPNNKLYPLEFTQREYKTYSSGSWNFGVKTGDLILFPSSLFHKVPPVNSDKTRVSLAFNTFVRGDLMNPDNLSALDLQ